MTAPGDALASRRATRRKTLGTIVFFVCAVIGISAIAYVFVAPSIDSTGQKWIRCDVYSARAGFIQSRSATYAVSLSTSCGAMELVNHGYSESTMNSIARGFTPHTKYDLKLGRISQFDVRMGWSGAEVQAWRKAA